MACYNVMVPYLCPDLAAETKAGAGILREGAIFVYARRYPELEGVRRTRHSPDYGSGSYYSYIALDFPVSLGGIQISKPAGEPAALFLLRTPCSPGARDATNIAPDVRTADDAI